MKTWGVVLVSISALTLSGAAQGRNSPPHPVTQHVWNLVQISQHRGMPIILPYEQQARHQLQFGRNGRLSLTLDCNRGSADWKADRPRKGGGKLKIGLIISTRALCPPPSQGETMAADLSSAKKFMMQADGRSMTIETRHNVYSFVAAEMGMGNGDALVPGTNYHATTQLLCSFNGSTPRQRCAAGVIRNWQDDGTTLVEVTSPDGRKRAIFFKGTRAFGADSAQADGSASYRFRATRRRDETTISYGPERYVIPDALITGG